MPHLTVHIARHLDVYRVAVHVDGQIEPTTVFGCRPALAPLVAALLAAQDEDNRIAAGTETHTPGGPSTIAFHLPGSRVVTFARILAQERIASGPQSLS